MELRQLVYFRTVADLEHVTKAAEKLLVAQSAISRQIHLLEEELGSPLFIRDGKHIRLSQFGERFLPHAERILRDLEAAEREAEHFQDPDTGTVRLGFPHSVGLYYVPQLIAAFRREAPQIRFDLVQSRVRDLLAHLHNREIDVAIITPWESDQGTGNEEVVTAQATQASPIGEVVSRNGGVAETPETVHRSPSGEVVSRNGGDVAIRRAEHEQLRSRDAGFIQGRHLYDEEMRIVLPAEHPLAVHSQIPLQALRDESFILFKEGYTLRSIVWDACSSSGFTPRIAFEAEETDTIRAFVRAGLGVSLLPAGQSGGERGLSEVAVAGEPILRSVGLVWWRDQTLSGAAKRFVDYAVSRRP